LIGRERRTLRRSGLDTTGRKFFVAALQLKNTGAYSKLNDGSAVNALGSEFVRLMRTGASNKFTSKKYQIHF
jgi:hypothetical protein